MQGQYFVTLQQEHSDLAECVCMCEDSEWPRCFSCDLISNQNLWDEQRSERVDAEHFLELDTSSVHMHTQQLTTHINRDLVC